METTLLSTVEVGNEFTSLGQSNGRLFSIYYRFLQPGHLDNRLAYLRERFGVNQYSNRWVTLVPRDGETHVLNLSEFEGITRHIEIKAAYTSGFEVDFYEINPTSSGEYVPGLTGEYFEDTGLTNLAFTRIDPNLDFDWGNNAPDPRLPSEGYSVRWTGEINLPKDSNYYFYLPRATPARWYLNGDLTWDKQSADRFGMESQSIQLTAGYYTFVLEMWDDENCKGEFRMWWDSPSTGQLEVIPAEFFRT